MSDFAPILIPTSESVRVTWGDQEAEIEAIEFVKWQIEKADAALLAFFASKLELGYELLEPCFDLDDEDQQTEFATAVESLTVISYSADEEAFSTACKTMERLKRIDSERILPLIAERVLDSSDGLQAYLETRLDHADPWAGLGLYDGFAAPIVVLSEGQFMPYVEPCGDRVMMDSWNVSDIWVRNNDEGDILFNVAS